MTDCGSAPVPLADRGGEHVGDEETDGLRLLILVGACGAFVAVLRTCMSEVRGPPVPAGLIRSADVPMCSPAVKGWCTQTRSQGVNGPRALWLWGSRTASHLRLSRG